MAHHPPVTATPPAPPAPRSVSWRLAFGAMLALAMGSGTYAGYVFGVLGPDLVEEFGVSRFQLGLLTTVFFLVGGSLSLVAGRATDRFGARRVMLAAFAVAAVATLGMALSPSYWVIVAFAALAGVALAAGNPVTNKLIAEHIPPGRRGLIMGSKQAGVQVGAFLAGALLAPLAVALGWQSALGWSAVLPAASLLGVLVIIPPDPPSQARRAAMSSTAPLPHGVRWLAAYAFLMGSGVATVNAYLPLYLVERAHAPQELAGAVVATIGFVGIGSRVAWGWASERLRSFSTSLVALGTGAVAAILGLLAVEPLGLWVAWPAAIAFGASAVTWNAVGMLAVITASGRHLAGRATGAVTTGFYIGFVASPVAFGWLVDRTGGYTLAWALVAAAFAGTIAVALGWRRVERPSPAASAVSEADVVP
jgi:MFS family permease